MYNKGLYLATIVALGIGISACSPRHDTLCLGSTVRSCEPSIYFAFNSTSMNRNAPRNLDWIAQKVKTYPDRTVYVVGHADLDGEKGYNEMLSLKRAKAVRDALIKRGVPANQIHVQGVGQTNPLTLDLEQQQLNRRADVTFDHVPHTYTCNDE